MLSFINAAFCPIVHRILISVRKDKRHLNVGSQMTRPEIEINAPPMRHFVIFKGWEIKSMKKIPDEIYNGSIISKLFS